LELAIVLPTIPIAAKQWMQSVEKRPPVNGIDLVWLSYAGIIASEAVLAGVQIARYWPVYRHWRRNLRGQSPRPAAILLAISGALGTWFLFDPVLMPTGAVAAFRTPGSMVTHLAVDDSTNELAIASQGPSGSVKSRDSVTIQIATFPKLNEVEAEFDGVPWVVQFDRDRLLAIAFHQRLLTAHLGESFIPELHTFRVWHRDRSSQIISSGAPNFATLSNGGRSILDELG